jgi:hypothetical protein
MTDSLRKHRKPTTTIALLILIGVCSMLWSWIAVIRGHLTARFDIARGHYELLSYGLPPPWRPEYARLLHERYGIEFRSVAGCVVSQSLVSYVGAYDDESTAAAIQKFGHDVFQETAAEACTSWETAATTQTKKVNQPSLAAHDCW